MDGINNPTWKNKLTYKTDDTPMGEDDTISINIDNPEWDTGTVHYDRGVIKLEVIGKVVNGEPMLTKPQAKNPSNSRWGKTVASNIQVPTGKRTYVNANNLQPVTITAEDIQITENVSPQSTQSSDGSRTAISSLQPYISLQFKTSFVQGAKESFASFLKRRNEFLFNYSGQVLKVTSDMFGAVTFMVFNSIEYEIAGGDTAAEYSITMTEVQDADAEGILGQNTNPTGTSGSSGTGTSGNGSTTDQSEQ